MQYEKLDIKANGMGFRLEASKEDGRATLWSRFYFDSDGTAEDTLNAMTDLIHKLTAARDEMAAKHGVDQVKVVTAKVEKGGA